MKWLSDETLSRLRAADVPDLSGTRYRLIECIGRGGMGAVYLAEDASLGRQVALKVLDVSDPSGELAERLLREARVLARLEHPGIVPVHDVGTLPDGRVFYTMKFVQGARLDGHLQPGTPVSDRLRIFQRICEAVAFAHSRGVLHRDLKPENIMVGPFGEVLVMDWGLAKIVRDSANPESAARVPRPASPREAASGPERGAPEATSTDPPVSWTAHGTVLGTPGYMAPEQARGEVDRLDERADVYSLGAILRHVLGAHAAPRPLAAICGRAMADAQSERYASAQELADDVARYLDRRPVVAYPENLVRKALRLYDRHRVAVILVLVYALSRALIVIFLGR